MKVQVISTDNPLLRRNATAAIGISGQMYVPARNCINFAHYLRLKLTVILHSDAKEAAFKFFFCIPVKLGLN